jgi:hypothetical protein
MSRIPDAEWVRIAEDARKLQSFPERVQLVSGTFPQPAAALLALNHEASAVIARLAELVERGSNSVLIDKATTVVARWNQSVREAESHLGASVRRA